MVSINPKDFASSPDENSAKRPEFINKPSPRDADRQFFGYIYQYALTLYHILDEKNVWNA